MCMSQLSVTQPSTKRHRPTTMDNMIILSKDKNNKIKSIKKPNYLNTSDHIFKIMLKNSLEGVENIIQVLDTLQYARTYAQLMNDLFCLRLKQDYWNYYYQVAIIPQIWPLTVSKQMMKTNNLHRIRWMTKDNVEKRQKMIIEEIKHIEKELNEHKQQLISDRFNDINQLATIIPAFVRKGQYKLSREFERKKSFLRFDMNDY